MLQELPIVISVFVIANFVFDTVKIDSDWLLAPLAGGSIYVLIRLYMVSRVLYVSRWAKALYVTLIAVCSIDFADSIFNFSYTFVGFQELVFCMFITGVLSSLCTYVHGKWQNSRKKQ